MEGGALGFDGGFLVGEALGWGEVCCCEGWGAGSWGAGGAARCLLHCGGGGVDGGGVRASSGYMVTLDRSSEAGFEVLVELQSCCSVAASCRRRCWDAMRRSLTPSSQSPLVQYIPQRILLSTFLQVCSLSQQIQLNVNDYAYIET